MSQSVKCNDLVSAKRVKAISVARLVAELDLESILRKQLDDRSDFAGGKAKLGNVSNEGDRVEKADG